MHQFKNGPTFAMTPSIVLLFHSFTRNQSSSMVVVISSLSVLVRAAWSADEPLIAVSQWPAFAESQHETSFLLILIQMR